MKGGTDLVGDSYDPDPNSATFQPTPHPDPNPLDCNGHGSHVAGTAGGNGVKADGTTFHGPYDASTVTNPGDWIIGPGVAPKADLYAVRVFGCQGPTDVVVDAIEWAVDNDMDVINMSLGSPFGASDDASAKASTNAAKAGVVVVAAAGNNGLNQYVVGSPGSGDGVIAVAANDSTQSFPGALVTIPAGDHKSDRRQRLRASPHHDVCEREGADGRQPARLQRGRVRRAAAAQHARGRATRGVRARRQGHLRPAGRRRRSLMVNNVNALPPFEGPITEDPDNGVPFVVTIPFLGVSLADGPAFAAAAGASATVVPANINNPTFKQMASFSSGGPRNVDSSLKPEITAPGVGIFSTGVGTGNGALNDSELSMATPHVTGVAALTIQAHPTWKVPDIKAAIVNTGAPTGVAGYRISSAGTGLVQPANLDQDASRGRAQRREVQRSRSIPRHAGAHQRLRASRRPIQLSNNGIGLGELHGLNAPTRRAARTPVTFNKTTVSVPCRTATRR